MAYPLVELVPVADPVVLEPVVIITGTETVGKFVLSAWVKVIAAVEAAMPLVKRV